MNTASSKQPQLTAEELADQLMKLGDAERDAEVTEILTTLVELRNDRNDDPDTWLAGYLAAFDVIDSNHNHSLDPAIVSQMHTLMGLEKERHKVDDSEVPTIVV